jgi:hypothetical protein
MRSASQSIGLSRCKSSSGAEFSGDKMNFHPQFSFELSEGFGTETFLADEDEKDGIKTVISRGIKKIITGSTKKQDSPKGLGPSWNASTDNFCNFDDSYQQVFVFEGIGSGDSKKENSNNLEVAESSPVLCE